MQNEHKRKTAYTFFCILQLIYKENRTVFSKLNRTRSYFKTEPKPKNFKNPIRTSLLNIIIYLTYDINQHDTSQQCRDQQTLQPSVNTAQQSCKQCQSQAATTNEIVQANPQQFRPVLFFGPP